MYIVHCTVHGRTTQHSTNHSPTPLLQIGRAERRMGQFSTDFDLYAMTIPISKYCMVGGTGGGGEEGKKLGQKERL